MSLNIHEGREASKWDDLISLNYVLIYLFKGSLPWMGLRAETTSQKYEKIAQKKRSTTLSQLCDKMPSAFETLLNTCIDKSTTNESPDYLSFYLLFRSCATKYNIKLDFIYDWSMKNFDATSILAKVFYTHISNSSLPFLI